MSWTGTGRDGWPLVPLADVAVVQGGLQLSGARRNLPVEVPYLRVANVHRGRLDLSEIKAMRVTESEYKRALLESGDLLIVEGHGNPAEIGRVAIWDGSIDPCTHQNHLIRVRLDQTLVLPDYVCDYMNSMVGRQHLLRAARTTSGLNTISVSDVKTVPILVPSVEDQRAIIAVMEQLKELRWRRQDSVALLEELSRSIFFDMFGDVALNDCGWDDSRTLGEVADIVSGITKGRKAKGPFERVPYLAVANVQDMRLDLSTVKEIDVTSAEISKYQLKRDDLLLTEGGDPDKLGRGTLWREEWPLAIHQNHIFRVRLRADVGLDPVFLNWLVGSERGRWYFLRSAKQTTGIASINATQLRKFPLLVPPLDLQCEFAGRIAKLEAQKAINRTHLAALDTLFASFQYRVFQEKAQVSGQPLVGAVSGELQGQTIREP